MKQLIAIASVLVSSLAFAGGSGSGGGGGGVGPRPEKFRTIELPDFVRNIQTVETPMEWVRFRNTQGDKITFEYTWAKTDEKGSGEVQLDRSTLGLEHADLIDALSESKASGEWKPVLK